MTTAALGTGSLTLADVAKRLDPQGRVAKVAELLSQSNDILEDMVVKEGNLPTGHQENIRTGLPTVYYRALNQGVPSSKSTTAAITEPLAMLEARSQIDVKVARLNGNTSEFRLSEDAPFLEAMNQKQAYGMFYGNPATDPRQYPGLATRYSSTSAGNGGNIINANGSGNDQTSIWLVGWGPETAFGFYPKGSTAGLNHEDLGEGDAFDANNNRFRALMALYEWDLGLCIKDWRYVVRGANVDVTNLVAESSAANLFKLMSRMIDRIPNMGMCRPVFYANRTVYSMLRIQALNTSTTALKIEDALDQFGRSRKETSFLGVPLRMCDAILNTESAIS